MLAPINKILPYSVVDGPGSRAAVFFQACNIACKYCHNPETQNLCDSCGKCVPVCPSGALTCAGGRVTWNSALCAQCDSCLAACPKNASPKVVWMTPEDVFAQIAKSLPFIRGISTSGGECALYPAFLTRLYTLAHENGLTCLMDSNGTIDLSNDPALMRVCDGVMLDVKSWDADAFKRLTGGSGENVRKNLVYLEACGKLAEIRIVVVPGYVDADAALDGIARTLSPETVKTVLLKLIRFRPFGVRGELAGSGAPSMEVMLSHLAHARSAGFENAVIL